MIKMTRQKWQNILLATALASSLLLAIDPLGGLIYAQEVQVDDVLTQSKVALGASLNEEQKQHTLNLLRATDVDNQQIISVDGKMIEQFLADGSNEETLVYSSAIIEPREAGYGVQVQIVTPNNITLVAPQTYQNAAITAGAKDVLIKIAAVEPVTGEGALTGVYAIYEALGYALDPQDIEVAQKEIVLVKNIQESSELTVEQTNQLQAQIKLAINQVLQANGELTTEDLNDLVLSTIEHYLAEIDKDKAMTEEVIAEYVSFAEAYVHTQSAQSETTNEQLNASFNLTWTLEEAIDFWEASFLSGNADEFYINVEEYDRELWTEFSENQSDSEESATASNTIRLNYDENLTIQFEKRETEVILTLYTEVSHYPYEPSATYSIDRQTFEVLDRNDLSEATEAADNEVVNLWNDDKANQLASFMATWGEGMGQTYQSFTPEAPGDMYGVSFPNDVLTALSVNETPVNASWSTTGEAAVEGEYVIVAAFNDVEHFFEVNPTAPAGAHFYLFTILDGIPVVLHSQQNQGTPDGRYYFTPSENMELQAGFENIVNQ